MKDKVMVVQKCLYPNILYILQYCNWRIEDFDDIEKEISKILVRITRNMASFPRSLLYIDNKDGGLGLGSIGDLAQKRKLSILEMGLGSKGIVGLSFRCLLKIPNLGWF